jgi:hypothetical protein
VEEGVEPLPLAEMLEAEGANDMELAEKRERHR